MILAIFFDLDGTLVDRASALRRYVLDLMDHRPDAFPEHRREADLRALLDGQEGPAGDCRDFGRRLASAFPALGWTAGQAARDCSSRLAGFVEPDPAVARLLEGLAGRFRLAIVSNGSGRAQRAKLARLGLGDASPRAFISGELGVAKPDPTPFRKALEWAGCRADQALFVGDDPAVDIAGATKLGMATCWVSGGRPYPVGLATPDRTIARVTSLGEVLR